jgi:peptidyl-prolyl isomerase E (cyclophilin E)
MDCNIFNILAGKLQGFGYVEFEKDMDARNAIDNMHLTEFFGLVIRCNLAHGNPFRKN